jgi:hypothetical protein
MKRFLVFMLLLLTAQGRVVADPVPEYVMKATYLYNFALYTEWPVEVGNEIQLCIFGEDRFGEALHAIDGKDVNGRRLVVRHAHASEEIARCQMLYLAENELQGARHMLTGLRGSPVLTITEGAIPLYSGVMISLLVEDKRLAFKVNASAARKARLNISSKLLRLASSVYQ